MGEYSIHDIIRENPKCSPWKRAFALVARGHFVIDPDFPDFYIEDKTIDDLANRRAYQTHGDRVFSHRYMNLVREIVNDGTDQINARTESVVRTLIHRNINAEIKFGIPLPGMRRVNPAIAAAELAWVLMGTEDITWLQKHTKIWDKFAVDGKVEGAYGQRWRNEFGRDQLAGAIDVLRREPSSRQIMVSAWHPGKDGLNAHSKALVPCPVDFTMQVLNNRLNVAVHMRSSDVAVGLPYDTMFYALLLDALACETKLKHGKLTMNLDHAHIYETHLHDMKTLPNISASTMELPGYSISRIMQNPDVYVRRVKTLAARAHQPDSSLKFSAVAAPKL